MKWFAALLIAAMFIGVVLGMLVIAITEPLTR